MGVSHAPAADQDEVLTDDETEDGDAAMEEAAEETDGMDDDEALAIEEEEAAAAAAEAAAAAAAEDAAEAVVVAPLFASGVQHTDDTNQYLYDNHASLDAYYHRDDLVTNPWILLASSDQQSDFDGSNHSFVNGVTTQYQTGSYDLMFVQYAQAPLNHVIDKYLIIQGSKLNDYSTGGWEDYSEYSLGQIWHGGTNLWLYRKQVHSDEPIIAVNDVSDGQSTSLPAHSTNALFHDGPSMGTMLRRVYYRAHDLGHGMSSGSF